ncbi:MFS transporter, partial [Phytophthora palmivora]
MNRRQAQRTLAELISKCEAAHIQLPEDPLEARAEAVEAIIHSLKDGKVTLLLSDSLYMKKFVESDLVVLILVKADLSDAQDELQQKYGLELVWKQHMASEEAKRQRRRQAQQKKRTNRTRDPKLTTNLEFLLEASPQNDQAIQATNSDEEHQPIARDHKLILSKGGVMMSSKRPITDQDAPKQQNVGKKSAKKVKNTREFIIPGRTSIGEDRRTPGDINL